MVGNGSRAAIISDRRITGLSAEVIAELVAEVGPLSHERHQVRLESRPRERAVGAGAKHRLIFIDRLLATLVHLRHGATHDVLACWFGVDRSTITRAIGEVRSLLATRGCTIATGVRLRTLADVIDHLGVGGQTGIIDGTEIRVRRRAAGLKDREKFISGKNKQNAVKAVVLTDASGQLLFCSPAHPASCADITHARQLGLVKHLTGGPAVEILADAGYQRRSDRRPRGDTTAPQVQEEPAGVVRGDLRASAQGALLTPDPGRARHRTPQELAGTRSPPRPTRAGERHGPSHRRTAFTPADHHPREPSATVTTAPTCTFRCVTANHARARKGVSRGS
ncbi:transposase family protein [Streptomyces sp. NPDC088748]|uniref:transposase family protein n=1 Tax=Streptomyces sp. NPDC088748 TaxID=3365887 RepID=UPI00380A145E